MTGLRICLVTPFDWSQPHDVNEHVAGVATALRALGHHVTVLTASTRGSQLLAGRRALQDGGDAEVIALGAALPVSRRSRLGVPVGVRASLALALARGRFDVVHGFEPALPSLSYLALRDTEALGVATFISAERITYPPGRAQRERLLGRIDALLATSEQTAEAAALRFPGDYRTVPTGVDTDLFRPAEKSDTIVVELRQSSRPLVRALMRELRGLAGWELVLLRTRPLTWRPGIPRDLAGRVRMRTLRSGSVRAELLNGAAVFVPAPAGLRRVSLEAAAAGCAIADPPGVEEQPELAVAAAARLAEDAPLRERRAREARARAETQSFAALASELDALYTRLAGRRRPPRRPEQGPLEDRPFILADLHMHTSFSHDCSIPPEELVAHARQQGLGAIAVTDHNVFGGARAAVEAARGLDLVVIPGEEVKTDHDGEVIGLFLDEEIPRGMSFADTIAAIHEQNGLVYVPHPFDRMHAIPRPSTLNRHLGDVDVFEVYNARLLFEGYNDEALRFARKYNLTMGAGSDAHVLQGLGTGVVRMRAFRDAQEFLIALRGAEVLRRPKSLAYLQSLKWVAQVKEKVR
jgi:predicted metal-dependent phosphoesterase TrpH/glycosyltransferase involved in cell wall biosynthesis